MATSSKIINPYTHNPLPTRPYLTEAELFERVTECSRDFRRWRRVSVGERKELVSKFVDTIIKDKEYLKPIISDFTGKSFKNIE
jgi:acyl-CoA reductase-like NAD-dependent aldehyde dehydrogenase